MTHDTMKNTQTNIKESPLFWPAKLSAGAKGLSSVLHVLDETQIPGRLIYVQVKSTKDAVKVIREMKTRAFGQFLVVLNTFLLELTKNKSASDEKLVSIIRQTANALNNSRPTFPFSEVTSVVVGWAQKSLAEKTDVKMYVTKCVHGYLEGIRHRRLQRVMRIAEVIKNGDSILTHCNVSGELAMAAAICKSQGKKVHYFATETRPYFQGAKLTAWELQRMGANVTLIADNAVGTLMADGLVDKVIVGSDRSCANGDFANKIGTYQIAVLAKEFKVPFYVLTQPSAKVKKGDDMPIEVRDPKELLTFQGRKVYAKAVGGFYPGFDIVPNKFITESIAINVN